MGLRELETLREEVRLTYKNAVLFLYRWKVGHDTTNFHALLFTLISKSDPENRANLRRGFREEVQAFEDWQSSPNEEEFFKAFGVEP
jgi:hypothetical protein